MKLVAKQPKLLKKKKKTRTEISKKVTGTEKNYDSDENEERKPEKKKIKIKAKAESKENGKVKKIKKKSKSKNEIMDHKKQLEALKDIDPEFYTFLKQNDKKLLEFNLDDSEDDEIDDEKDEHDDEEDELVHKPNAELEVASDESDFEASGDEEEDGETKVITLKLLKSWQTQLQSKHVPIDIIRKVIQAFSSALATVAGAEDKISAYKVEGAAAFNGVVQLCVMHLQPAIYKFLSLSPKSKKPIHKCKKWKKVQSCLRSYLMDLTRLLEHVSSSNILVVLLKHLHQMASMVASFHTISKPVLKRLIVLWSTSEETVRVLSFLCILKITRNQQGVLLNHVLKAMYLSYVRNSKFVSPSTLPSINFMRRSLVEMFALDLNAAYQHVFLYIRQLAIHLRNAIILKKKESFQAVYNWQFVNSIKLWADVLGETYHKPQLQPLVYPLVSITTGVIKLIPTAQFFPLRFHCLQALITLSHSTNTFIPVLPFILEVLNSSTFNKKHTAVSMRPMQFTCILRLNKSQMAENGFRDEVVENVCGLTLEYLAHESCSLAFPDLVVPAVIALKQYLKTCKNSNHSRKLKQVLDKIIENSRFIEEERRKINFGLKDAALIQSWQTSMRNKGSPLNIYYSSWVKTHETKKKRQAANTDDINDYDVPIIKRRKIENKNGHAEEELELFPSDDEDEQYEVAEEQAAKKKKKPKKVKKTKPVEDDKEENDFDDDKVDIVKDLDIDDW